MPIKVINDKQLELLKRIQSICDRIEDSDKRTLNALERRGLIRLTYYNFEHRASITKEGRQYVDET